MDILPLLLMGGQPYAAAWWWGLNAAIAVFPTLLLKRSIDAGSIDTQAIEAAVLVIDGP